MSTLQRNPSVLRRPRASATPVPGREHITRSRSSGLLLEAPQHRWRQAVDASHQADALIACHLLLEDLVVVRGLRLTSRRWRSGIGECYL